MTKSALAKLNKKQLEYCNTLSFIINRARENGLKAEFEKNSGKLRGFLECLCQMEIISGSDVKTLHLWFFCDDRRKSNDNQ